MVYWTQKEINAFRRAIKKHGKDYDKIQAVVKTKTRDQCRKYAGHTLARVISKGDHPNADLLNILEHSLNAPEWTLDEMKQLLKGL